MKIIFYILFTLSFSFSQNEVGSSFLVGTNARELALSNSLVSSYNMGFNSFSNPALLNQTDKIEYGFSLFSLSLDRSIQSISFSMPLPPVATFGLSMFRSSIGNIQGYDSFGNQTQSEYSTYESYVMATFAMQMNALSVGASFKLYNSKLIDNVKADGIGFDLGFYKKINEKNSIGVKITNLSSKYNWSFQYNNFNQQYEEKLSTCIAVGYSSNIEFGKDNLALSTQLDFYDSDRYDLKLGLEYGLNLSKYVLNFRLGIKNSKNFDYSDNDISFGFGMPFDLKNYKMNFDYGITPGMVQEGISHVVSLTFKVN